MSVVSLLTIDNSAVHGRVLVLKADMGETVGHESKEPELRELCWHATFTFYRFIVPQSFLFDIEHASTTHLEVIILTLSYERTSRAAAIDNSRSIVRRRIGFTRTSLFPLKAELNRLKAQVNRDAFQQGNPQRRHLHPFSEGAKSPKWTPCRRIMKSWRIVGHGDK